MPFGYTRFINSQRGSWIVRVLELPQNRDAMIASAARERPPAEAIDALPEIIEMQPDAKERTLIGRAIRPIMERAGWTVGTPRQSMPFPGVTFGSGTLYHRATGTGND